MKSTVTFDHLFFVESLKLENVWDHSVNMKFNVFYSTFTNVFLFLSRFSRFFNVFFILISTFFTSMPKTAIAIVSGTDEAPNFKFGRYIDRGHPNKSPLKFGRKDTVGVSRDCPNFLEYPLLSQEWVNYELPILQANSRD